MCNKVMLLARKLDAQCQLYNIITFHEMCLEEIPLLLLKFEEPMGYIRGIIGNIFKRTVDVAS